MQNNIEKELQEIKILLEEILYRLNKNNAPTVVYPRIRTPRTVVVRKVESYDRR